MEAAEFVPVTVIGLDVTCEDRATPVRGAKLNASGTVSAARVVTLKVAVVPPMLRVAEVVVPNVEAERTRTCTI